jgi:Mn2+/Fe2+ NRAMP family transporter
MLAIPVLAGSASYCMSECFGWKTGLYRNLKQANAFYGIIIISTLIGVAINFIGIDPIKALVLSAVVNGLVAPIVLVLIVLISSNKRVMGDRVNHPLISAVGWILTAIMAVAGIATIAFQFI